MAALGAASVVDLTRVARRLALLTVLGEGQDVARRAVQSTHDLLRVIGRTVRVMHMLLQRRGLMLLPRPARTLDYAFPHGTFLTTCSSKGPRIYVESGVLSPGML